MLRALKKFLGLDKKGASTVGEKRVYHFDLPYKLPAVLVHYALMRLKKDGVFYKLPKDLQARLEKAKVNWHSINITKNDLDRLDDVTWTRIAGHLKLKWSPK